MAVKVEKPNTVERYVGPDGRLTIEGVKLLQRIVAAIDDHEARLVVGGL